MSLSEFSIIARYFKQAGLAADPLMHDSVVLGIGDDCAVLTVSPGKQLVLSMDVLNVGVHFPENAPSRLIGKRALAVNLSDLAAMGATPLGFTLGLSLPEVNEGWLEEFADGLKEQAEEFNCPLLGGDISKGPLNIAIQVHGETTPGKTLLRSGARPGDLVYVSGDLGAASAALSFLGDADYPEGVKTCRETLLQAYYEPQPRIALGRELQNLSSAAIDVSDGLLADLSHIAEASDVAIRVYAAKVPVAENVSNTYSEEKALHLAMTGGDDYELAFTVPASVSSKIIQLSAEMSCSLTCVGEVVSRQASESELVVCLDDKGLPLKSDFIGYRHF